MQKFLSHFLHYFSMTFLLMDIIQLIKETSVMYMPLMYATIVAMHAILSNDKKGKKKNFDCLNMTVCLILCIVAVTQQNVYAVFAALLNALINYVGTKPKNKRTTMSTPVLDKKNYLFLMFVYCAVFAITTTIEITCEQFTPKTCCEQLLETLQDRLCGYTILEPLACIPRAGSKILACCNKLMHDKIDEMFCLDDCDDIMEGSDGLDECGDCDDLFACT